MGLFGPDHFEENGNTYVNVATFGSMEEAQLWKNHYRNAGYLAQIKPDANKGKIDLFVCSNPINRPPRQMQPMQQNDDG